MRAYGAMIALLAFSCGAIIGYSARITSSTDRVQSAYVAERAARTGYYNAQAETMIYEARARVIRESAKTNGCVICHGRLIE